MKKYEMKKYEFTETELHALLAMMQGATARSMLQLMAQHGYQAADQYDTDTDIATQIMLRDALEHDKALELADICTEFTDIAGKAVNEFKAERKNEISEISGALSALLSALNPDDDDDDDDDEEELDA